MTRKRLAWDILILLVDLGLWYVFIKIVVSLIK
jgi:hypothetical protein